MGLGQQALAAKKKKRENHRGQPFDCPRWSLHLIRSFGFAAFDKSFSQYHRYRNVEKRTRSVTQAGQGVGKHEYSGEALSRVLLQVTLFRQRHASFVPYDDVIQRSHSDQVQRLL